MNALAVLLAVIMSSMATYSSIPNNLEYCGFSAEKPTMYSSGTTYGICGCGDVSVI